MSGIAGDSASTDEGSDPIQPNVKRPDEYASYKPETASKARERMAGIFEPGQTRASSRRVSDTPPSMRHQFRELSPRDSAQDVAEKGKSAMEKAHETVASALGGGSRGAS